MPKSTEGYFTGNPSFFGCLEDLAVGQLVSQCDVQILVVAVLPWVTGFDEQRPHNPAAGAESRNALFAGHDEGAKAWARIASLIETAKMNGVNLHAYLKATLEAIAVGHPVSDIDALMPWAYATASS